MAGTSSVFGESNLLFFFLILVVLMGSGCFGGNWSMETLLFFFVLLVIVMDGGMGLFLNQVK
ncbi:hypothetical protein [Thermoanaerobacterium sp. RBIITD]|uniref:hypothetical protein n=1 Tax=Thermoanaerobacterium sp. RBIITD TaxID=1550240 RepID=UPI000BB6DF13|nr:hypothetical protein [Thermoanaerobacterium sp. RBIITD]SNX53061.1 hypothetical protein SAMN05660242_0553 [Thermoanaerobacterium sp. RBIITD]